MNEILITVGLYAAALGIILWFFLEIFKKISKQ